MTPQHKALQLLQRGYKAGLDIDALSDLTQVHRTVIYRTLTGDTTLRELNREKILSAEVQIKEAIALARAGLRRVNGRKRTELYTHYHGVKK